MKLHLPLRLFKSILACLAVVASVSLSSGVSWAKGQNLIFNGTTLIWNTGADNQVFTNENDESVPYAQGDNVSFESTATISLGEGISAGQICIAKGADVVINTGSYMLDFSTLELQGGTLDMGDSLRLCSGDTLAVGANDSILKSALILGGDATLHVDFSGGGASTNLNNSSLTLQSCCRLQLENCGEGDGKTYTLLSGISELIDAQGNTITLNSTNNAVSNYFDSSQPGTGFWADATLQLNNGNLQLVRHTQVLLPDKQVVERSIDNVDYQYHVDIAFKNFVYTSSDSEACGSAVRGTSITLNNNGGVAVSENTLSGSSYKYAVCGGAIYGCVSSTISLCHNGNVCISGNSASYTGPSIMGGGIHILACGGAIYGGAESLITLSYNESVNIIGNTSSCPDSYLSVCAYGGAIYGGAGSIIMLQENTTIGFSNNATSDHGGAIYGDSGSTITLSNNGGVTFSGNTASYGGAIYGGSESIITLSNNGSVTFSDNMASSYGGAIYGDSTITLSHNSSVTFSDNMASSYGGAIYGGSESTITLSHNGSVTFSGNTASSSLTAAYGGAIYGDSTITLSHNSNVTFSGNTASGNNASGGAICMRNERTITIWITTAA